MREGCLIELNTRKTPDEYTNCVSQKKTTTYLLYKEKLSEDINPKIYYYSFEPSNYGYLHSYVVKAKRLTEDQSKYYFRQICHIVEFCHSRSVIIQELKLRKFVFADRYRQIVKLDNVDEMALCSDKESKMNSELPDVDEDFICNRHGCPTYVSPEILDPSKKWYSGKAADVWNLGVLLYVLTLGRYPFYDVNPAALLAKIRQARIQLSDKDGACYDANRKNDHR